MMGFQRTFDIFYILLLSCVLSLIFSATQGINVHEEKYDVNGLSKQSSYFFYQQSEYPRDCYEVLDQCSVTNSSGVYFIKPDGYHRAFEVYCDNDADGGGWTVFQRRNTNALDFNRPWTEYKNGFGFPRNDFWLGNERLSFLTNQKDYEIRIDIENTAGLLFYAQYNLFRISDQWSNFKLSSLGQYGGNADSFVITCLPNMEFRNCTCQPTCEDPDGSECLVVCSEEESCVCQRSFVREGGHCVPLEQCSCFIQDVGILEKGQSYINADCTSRYECLSSGIVWENDYECSSDATCKVNDGVRRCYCNDGFSGDGQNCEVIPTDCSDIYNAGDTDSGIYTIKPRNWPGSPFEVYCNMTDGGGWTVFQRRVNGSENFYLGWNSYKEGFGLPDHELWLGNDKIYFLTNQKDYQLRIDLVNRNRSPFYAKYNLFRINDEEDNYRLVALGSYTGDTGNNAFLSSKDKLFSTYDRDNDGWDDYNCAERHVGAWWYRPYNLHTSLTDCQTNGMFCEAWQTDNGCGYCSTTNLNGDYDGSAHGTNIHWSAFTGYDECRYTYTEMKIKPL